MGDFNERDKKYKEIWKLWDVLFSGGFFSFFKDCEEARSDDQKFKQLLSQMAFGIVFVAVLFGVAFLVVT